MSIETDLRPAETLTDPGQMDPNFAAEIAYGLRTPNYGQLLAFREYVSGFSEHHSSVRKDDVPSVYSRAHPGNPNVRVTWSAQEYAPYQQAAQFEHWELSKDDEANTWKLLMATSLDEVSGSGRHRSSEGTPGQDAQALRALQADGLRRLALHHDILEARKARLADTWANSHHAVRLGINGSAAALGRDTLQSLMDGNLAERLRYVTPAAPLSPADRELATALRQESAQTQTHVQPARPTQETVAPNWRQRAKRALGRLFLK
jgi:hypothetical protein